MKLLAFETSGVAAGVALLLDGALLLERATSHAREAAERLLPMCDEVLSQAGYGVKDIDAFAVSVGPGSFTGVRIGICAANALAQARGASVIEVGSLQALSLNAAGNVVSAVDARRERVYAQGFGEAPFALGVLTLDELLRVLGALKDGVTLVGDAAMVYAGAFSGCPHVRLGTQEQSYIRAGAVGALAYEKWLRGETTHEAKPVYITKPQAERVLDESAL